MTTVERWLYIDAVSGRVTTGWTWIDTAILFGGLVVMVALWWFFSRLWQWLISRLFVPTDAHEAIAVACAVFAIPPPRVYWIKTADGAYRDISGNKLNGDSPHRGACNVGWHDGMRFSESALAHEIGHCWLWRRGVPGGGPGHEDAIYQPGGTVEQAIARLRAWEDARA